MEKTVFVAFVGRPNVGKSSVINSLVDNEVLIVSNKAQTTRNKIAAIQTNGDEQFVFFDTPGFFKARDLLGRKMLKAIDLAVSDVDVLVFVVEPKMEISIAEKNLINKFKKLNMPVILAINKIDLVKNKSELALVVSNFSSFFVFNSVVFVSAKNRCGFSDLISEIRKYEVECAHFFPDNMVTDKSDQFIASEVFRQNLLLNLREEIPHSLIVEVDEFKRNKFGLKISVVVYCSKYSHKGIVIGKNGSVLKKVATQSRKKMENLFNCRVILNCWVKVKPKWKQDEKFLKILEN